MPLREAPGHVAPHPVASASRRLSGRHLAFPISQLSLSLCFLFLLQPLAAKIKPTAALDPGYVPALAAADRLLQSWQSGDAETGMILLTTHANHSQTPNTAQDLS